MKNNTKLEGQNLLDFLQKRFNLSKVEAFNVMVKNNQDVSTIDKRQFFLKKEKTVGCSAKPFFNGFKVEVK